MKVILIRDVAKLGRKSSVVEVPSGHALNFLIPRKMAIPATPDNVKKLAEEERKHSAQAGKERDSFLHAADVLRARKVMITTDVNDKGHLYKGVGIDDIHKALLGLGLSIEKRAIMLKEPIKSVGKYEITLTHGAESAICHLEIVKR